MTEVVRDPQEDMLDFLYGASQEISVLMHVADGFREKFGAGDGDVMAGMVSILTRLRDRMGEHINLIEIESRSEKVAGGCLMRPQR